MRTYRLIQGDALAVLRTLPAESVQCCVTSPPYWGLRDYGVEGQLGLERTPQEYVDRVVAIFREVRRVLRDDGVLWLVLGDCYVGAPPGNARPDHSGPRLLGTRSGQKISKTARARAARSFGDLKPKDLVGIPWRVAFALQADGWWLRMDVIWSKPNPMPSSVKDRPTGAHEYVFLLSKSAVYCYDADAISEPAVSPPKKATDMRRGSSAMRGQAAIRPRGKNEATDDRRRRGFNERRDAVEAAGEALATRNARSVWTIATQPYEGAHFATFPEALAERCVLAGSRAGDVVLEPFAGSGTVGVVALKHAREFIGIDLNPAYLDLAHDRIRGDAPLLNRAVP